MTTQSLIAMVVAGGIALLAAAIFLPLLFTWYRGRAAGIGVSLQEVIEMRLRKVNAAMVIDTAIRARDGGLQVDLKALDTHYISGGSIDAVVDGLLAARREGLLLTWRTATALDLTGRDVVVAVRAVSAAQRAGRVSKQPTNSEWLEIALTTPSQQPSDRSL